MFRFLPAILLFTIVSCDRKSTDNEKVDECQYGKDQAMYDFAQGKNLFVRIGRVPRYDSVLEILLERSGIEYDLDFTGHYHPRCYASTMENLVKMKFGDDFVDKLESVADSLFFEARKNETFPYYEVDTWASRTNSDLSLGGEFVIQYLNERLPTKSTYSFGSNTVNRPYYLIKFSVNKTGETRNVEIAERHNTDKFKEAEALIVEEVSRIRDWTPATIRNQAVTARFQMGVAIEPVQ